jgi:hypothetical protein
MWSGNHKFYIKLSRLLRLQSGYHHYNKVWITIFIFEMTENFGRHCLSIQKKNCNPYFIVIMITVLIMNVIFWVVNFKTQNYFVISIHRTFTSGYLCTIALILFIHVGFLKYLSFKQFKLIVKPEVKLTRIESAVTIPKGLFTLYLNVKKV